MTDASRRRLLAIAAFVLGVFLGLTLLPLPLTGPIGEGVGTALWRYLGIGAVGVPVVGIGLGLAGFRRVTPGTETEPDEHGIRMAMVRIGGLVLGLSVLVPYVIGVVTRTTHSDFNTGLGAIPLAARLTGLIPTFLAQLVMSGLGFAGGLLVGFLLLSALTLVTIAWHPLQRLERAREIKPAGRPVRPFAVPEDEPEVPRAGASESNVLVKAPTAIPERKAKKAKKTPPASRSEPSADDETALPPIELLEPPEERGSEAGEAALDRLGAVLLETLRTFKVEGSIAGRTTGPVVTQFEVVPAPGVKVGKIAALADDLALAMHAPSIRIVAPIPGRGAVGVEVPNPTPTIVMLRELIETPEWSRARSALPIALGRDLEGKPVIADLAKMPHLLIAGATGSGKSVAVNTIITSLVYRYTPRDLRLLMIDPKMVELSMYNSLPHLRHQVVTNNHEAATVLKWAVFEMTRRYELLHANGARNMGDFNRKVAEGKPLQHPPKPKVTLTTIAEEEPDTPPPEPTPEAYEDGPLPYIVMIVDELADLMMTVQGEVETPLAILAQKARAIGIHIILATQRPSVNVITGLIKANFPSRIGFRVASKVDSRTILDQNGAEALLGNGDMLFLPPGKSEPMRLQGAYIGTEETERVMDWYVTRREARRLLAAEDARPEEDILEVVRAQEEEEAGGPSGEDTSDRDPLFREAAEACLQNQGGSTSLLQRKLRIGYGRAARVIDQLYAAGILGPPDGSKPREVLIGFDQLDEYL